MRMVSYGWEYTMVNFFFLFFLGCHICFRNFDGLLVCASRPVIRVNGEDCLKTSRDSFYFILFCSPGWVEM